MHYEDVFTGPEQWRAIEVDAGGTYGWEESTYIKEPPFFRPEAGFAQPLEVSGARSGRGCGVLR